MIQVLLFLHLVLQPQAVASQAAAQAKVLLQSGIDVSVPKTRTVKEITELLAARQPAEPWADRAERATG